MIFFGFPFHFLSLLSSESNSIIAIIQQMKVYAKGIKYLIEYKKNRGKRVDETLKNISIALRPAIFASMQKRTEKKSTLIGNRKLRALTRIGKNEYHKGSGIN